MSCELRVGNVLGELIVTLCELKTKLQVANVFYELRVTIHEL